MIHPALLLHLSNSLDSFFFFFFLIFRSPFSFFRFCLRFCLFPLLLSSFLLFLFSSHFEAGLGFFFFFWFSPLFLVLWFLAVIAVESLTYYVISLLMTFVISYSVDYRSFSLFVNRYSCFVFKIFYCLGGLFLLGSFLGRGFLDCWKNVRACRID